MAYITVDELAARLGNRIQPADRELVDAAIDEACAAIDLHCGQSFAADTVATARLYAPTHRNYALVDPFHTTTGLVVKTDGDDDGVFETTWSASLYDLVRFGGARANLLGAPYDTIRAVGAWFPTGRRSDLLQVTAQWGWAAVPSNVVAATKIVAHDLWKRKDVAFGISTSGVAEFGGMRIGRDVLGQVTSLLAPVVRADRMFGIG